MSVPSKMHNIPLVQIRHGEEIAASQWNLACANKPTIDSKIVQVTLLESDLLRIPVKLGKACGLKGLVEEPLGHGYIYRAKMWVIDASKAGFITYTGNGKEVLLKSRMREKHKSCSVRGFIAASGSVWLRVLLGSYYLKRSYEV